jgi:hypothetical protein
VRLCSAALDFLAFDVKEIVFAAEFRASVWSARSLLPL